MSHEVERMKFGVLDGAAKPWDRRVRKKLDINARISPYGGSYTGAFLFKRERLNATGTRRDSQNAQTRRQEDWGGKPWDLEVSNQGGQWIPCDEVPRIGAVEQLPRQAQQPSRAWIGRAEDQPDAKTEILSALDPPDAKQEVLQQLSTKQSPKEAVPYHFRPLGVTASLCWVSNISWESRA